MAYFWPKRNKKKNENLRESVQPRIPSEHSKGVTQSAEPADLAASASHAPAAPIIADVKTLLNATQGSDRDEVIDAIRGLGEFDTTEVRDALRRLSRHGDIYIARAAASGLKGMGDLQVLDDWLGSGDRNRYFFAAEELSRMWDKATGASVLVRALSSDTKWEAAVWGITYELLSGDRPCLQDAAVRAAIQPAIPVLARWIDEGAIQPGASPLNLRVSRAVTALGRIADKDALPVLERLLSRLEESLGGEERRDFVATSNAAGYVSSNSAVELVRNSISFVKGERTPGL